MSWAGAVGDHVACTGVEFWSPGALLVCLLCCDDTSESWGCDASMPGLSLLDLTGQGFVGGSSQWDSSGSKNTRGGGHSSI